MKTSVKEAGSWKRLIEVEVSSEEARPHLDKAIHTFQKKARIDGFRKGKIPRKLVKQQFGKAIEAEVTDDLVHIFYRKALEETGLPVVSIGKISKVEFSADEPLRFVAEVEVEPEIPAVDFAGIKADREIEEVTDEDVRSSLDGLRDQKAERIDVADGARAGHLVEGDVQALDPGGIPILGQKWEDRVFELGMPPLGDQIQAQLLGVKPGDQRRFVVSGSERNPDGTTREREQHYAMTVKTVKEKRLPEIDDAFLKSLGDFPTLTDLEGRIRKTLEDDRSEKSERLLRSRIADEVMKRNPLDLPPSMVDNALKALWEGQKKEQDPGIDEATFCEKNRDAVVWNLKWHLLQKAIVRQENLAVPDAEVDQEIDRISTREGADIEKIKAWFKHPDRRKRLMENLLDEKIWLKLKETAKIKDVKLQDSKKGLFSIFRKH